MSDETTIMDCKAHWETIYATKAPTAVGWYEPHLRLSLEFIGHTGVSPEGQIIDVGGGASTLVDDLLAMGFRHITVLDISPAALAITKARLGRRAEDITWIEGDITQVTLPSSYYDVWHDRAVFHFLTSPADRRKYVEVLDEALKPGGHCIMATFASAAPPQCSGLDVIRYGAEQLHGEVRGSFELLTSCHHIHLTPGGISQPYLYCHFRKR